MDQEYLEKIINQLRPGELYFLTPKQVKRLLGPTLTMPLESVGVDLYDWIQN